VRARSDLDAVTVFVTSSIARFATLGLAASISVASARAFAQGTTSAKVPHPADSSVLLPTVAIQADHQSRTLQLSGFYDRQSAGIGAFITPENIQREQGRLIGEIVAKYSRISVRFGGTHAWLATNRSSSDGGCAFCRQRIQDLLDQADISAGARPACYMDVYLNGQAVYRGYGQNSHTPQPLFDLNSLAAREIEGIEIYSSAVQVPAKFNATSSGCGVAIIWTKH
jgi:hypothetical protein